MYAAEMDDKQGILVVEWTCLEDQSETSLPHGISRSTLLIFSHICEPSLAINL